MNNAKQKFDAARKNYSNGRANTSNEEFAEFQQDRLGSNVPEDQVYPVRMPRTDIGRCSGKCAPSAKETNLQIAEETQPGKLERGRAN